MKPLLLLALFIFPLFAFSQEAEPSRWSNIIHHAGPYGIKFPREVKQIAEAGFPFFVNGYFPPASPFYSEFQKYHLRYIDSELWGIVTRECEKQKPPSCQFSPEIEKNVLALVQQHLEETENDPLIIGYWILDDYNYTGSISSLLEKIHDLAAKANAHALVQRPTICGFGGRLDYKNNAADPVYHSSHRYFRNAAANFSPNACDMVALYDYGENTIPNPELIDWSMSALLPYQLVVLKKHGWDPERRPLIGITQTFSYPWKSGKVNFVEPRYEDIVTQTEAYCKWGAASIFFYAWDDSVSDPNKHQAFNTPFMVRGIQDGVKGGFAGPKQEFILNTVNKKKPLKMQCTKIACTN